MSTDRTDLEVRWALGIRDRENVAAGRSAERPLTPTTPVGVLDRSVAILDAVTDGARSFSAIQRATGYSRTTTHRLIAALEHHGFLFHVGGFGYALGPRLLGLAATAMRELPLRDLARPALERLAAVTGESAQLYVRDGTRRICVDAVGSTGHELRTIVDVGASLPLDRGSAGHVFLAWDDVADVHPDEQLERKTITTRRRGWAHSHGEREAGVASVSAPIFGDGGRLVAVVSLSGPAGRILPMRAKDLAPAVLDAAQAIRSALGPAA